MATLARAQVQFPGTTSSSQPSLAPAPQGLTSTNTAHMTGAHTHSTGTHTLDRHTWQTLKQNESKYIFKNRKKIKSRLEIQLNSRAHGPCVRHQVQLLATKKKNIKVIIISLKNKLLLYVKYISSVHSGLY